MASGLPSGTVTFVLTDVEGSTRLWEADREAMARAIARHYEIIDEAVSRNTGARPVEQGEGDSTVSAFARASDAVRAALEIQRAMRDEPWPEGAQIAVRIGIHTGEAQLRDDGNYFGSALSRCARLRALGHGGQTLLSRTTADVVGDDLPDGATVIDLGEHPLRDLARPERVYQLNSHELESTFPPLASPTAPTNNLPVELTSFIGRDAELAELANLIKDVRALTLTGTGGCGKTRLALRLAHQVAGSFNHGVAWVDLSALTDPKLVPSALAGALGVRELPTQELIDTLAGRIGHQEMLVTLDNCEHLAAACSTLADALLRACPNMTILVTSREPLRLESETSWHVPSLSLPDESLESIEDLTRSESIRLFVDRGSQARRHFGLSKENAEAIATICHRLDGIPLAIELAAARTRTLTPEQIADGLADRFRLLTGGARTALPRQRTLEASVDWSYSLLDEDERVVFRRLSVFAGGFTVEAAERVCADDRIEAVTVLDFVSKLVDRSLVQMEEGRYRMLETIRDYARHKLTDSGETVAVRNRHLAFFLELVERAESALESSELFPCAERLAADYDNIRAGMDWSVESGQTDKALRLPTPLPLFWIVRNHLREGRRRLAIALAMEGGEPVARARALVASSMTAQWLLSHAGRRIRSEQALALAREVGDQRTIGRALVWLGWDANTSNPPAAKAFLDEALATTAQCGDEWGGFQARACLAFRAVEGGDRTTLSLLQETLDTARSAGNPFHAAQVLTWASMAAVLWGRFDAADEFVNEAIAIERSMRDHYFLIVSLALSALNSLLRGRFAAARDSLTEASTLTAHTELDFPWALSELLLGVLAFAERDVESAETHAQRSLGHWRTANSIGGMTWCLVEFARIAYARGDFAGARTRAEEARQMAHDMDVPWREASALIELAKVARNEGDLAAAEELANESLAIAVRIGSPIDSVSALETLAGVAVVLESHEEAVRLVGGAQAARDALGFVAFSLDRDRIDADLSGARAAMSHDAFDVARKEGAALTLEEAVAYATRARGERKRPSHGWSSLTPTELQVVALVREGLTNPQIGERLFISKGTVRTHLTHVFSKLGVATRSELAAEATRRLV